MFRTSHKGNHLTAPLQPFYRDLSSRSLFISASLQGLGLCIVGFILGPAPPFCALHFLILYLDFLLYWVTILVV